jgi:WD40 repeat protein
MDTTTFEETNSIEDSGFANITPDFSTVVFNYGDLFALILEAYDLNTGEKLSETPFRSSYSGSVGQISPDGTRLIAEDGNYNQFCGGYIRGLYLIAIPSMQQVLDLNLPTYVFGSPSSDYNNLESQDFSSDSRLLAVSDGYSITIYDAQDGTELVELDETVSRLAYFNPDDTLIVTTGEDGTIRLYGVLPEGE